MNKRLHKHNEKKMHTQNPEVMQSAFPPSDATILETMPMSLLRRMLAAEDGNITALLDASEPVRCFAQAMADANILWQTLSLYCFPLISELAPDAEHFLENQRFLPFASRPSQRNDAWRANVRRIFMFWDLVHCTAFHTDGSRTNVHVQALINNGAADDETLRDYLQPAEAALNLPNVQAVSACTIDGIAELVPGDTGCLSLGSAISVRRSDQYGNGVFRFFINPRALTQEDLQRAAIPLLSPIPANVFIMHSYFCTTETVICESVFTDIRLPGPGSDCNFAFLREYDWLCPNFCWDAGTTIGDMLKSLNDSNPDAGAGAVLMLHGTRWPGTVRIPYTYNADHVRNHFYLFDLLQKVRMPFEGTYKLRRMLVTIGE